MPDRLILAGDIGGTKTYLALYAFDGATLRAVKEGAFVNSGYGGAGEVLGEFLGAERGASIESAALGVAGPVEGGRALLTNLGWTVDSGELARSLAIGRLGLLNDLASIGWGAPLLSGSDLYVLQQGAQSPGNAALIAAGTGLGEAVLFWDGHEHIVSPSEGGHADFAPRTEDEIALLEFLMQRHAHVSYERVVSGPGLEAIYEFVLSRRGEGAPESLKGRLAAEGMAPAIASEAIAGTDTACREALALFASIYGAEAGNLALKTLPAWGVYIGGGIAPRILKAMEWGGFMEAFRSKGRFRPYMERLPVKVILNDRAGLMGAANYAVSLLGPGMRAAHMIR